MLRCSLKFNPQSVARYQQSALWVKMSMITVFFLINSSYSPVMACLAKSTSLFFTPLPCHFLTFCQLQEKINKLWLAVPVLSQVDLMLCVCAFLCPGAPKAQPEVVLI